jgi:hypothetical protein
MNDFSEAWDARDRVLIVHSGRCGSSLLCVILADAGGDFGVPVPRDWSSASGVMRHPLARGAGRDFLRAQQLDQVAPGGFVYRRLARAWRSRGKRRARALLDRVAFAKGQDMDLWVPFVPKFGYRPRIVVPFRAPEPVARSFLFQAKANWHDTVERYARINANALLALHAFGGCAVELEDVRDPDCTAWADALAAVTGLDRKRLLDARAARLDAAGPPRAAPNRTPAFHLPDPQVHGVCEALRQTKNRTIAPSAQARRQFRAADGG